MSNLFLNNAFFIGDFRSVANGKFIFIYIPKTKQSEYYTSLLSVSSGLNWVLTKEK